MKRAVVAAYLAATTVAIIEACLTWVPWEVPASRALVSILLAAAQWVLPGTSLLGVTAAMLWLAVSVSYALSDQIVSTALRHGFWVFSVQAVLFGAAGVVLLVVAVEAVRGRQVQAPAALWARTAYAASHLSLALYLVRLALLTFQLPQSSSGGLDGVVAELRLAMIVMLCSAVGLLVGTIGMYRTGRARVG